MTEKLKLPDIGYSGGPLKVLAQLQVTISQGEYIMTISALILKDTPSSLLLAIGTDVRQSLYFSFTLQKPGETSSDTNPSEQCNTKGTTKMENSVTQSDDTCKNDSPAQQTEILPVIESKSVRTLCLAQPSQILFRCRKVGKAVLSTSTESCLP